MQEHYEAITSEQEFLEVMEQVDAELQNEQVPIQVRSIQAILKVGKRVGEGLIISPLPKTPVENVYSGPSLSTRISQWYKRRYGDRMKVDPCTYTAVMVREDVYKMRLPYFAGSLELICRPDLIGQELGPSMRTDGKPVVVNILDSIQGLTKNYAESLRDKELRELASRYVMALHALELMKVGAQHFSLVPEARGNMANAVELLFSTPPQYGLSKWESLQAAEKVLKAFISAHGAKFKFTHILEDLALSAELLGLPLIPRAELRDIQCSPQVRYGTPSVTPHEAIKAHQAALSVCGGVVVSLLRMKGIKPPVRTKT
jgi:hypothetical protein